MPGVISRLQSSLNFGSYGHPDDPTMRWKGLLWPGMKSDSWKQQ